MLTLLKSDANQFSLNIRKNTGGQYVPQVYMNNTDVTPGMDSLWRVMIPDVWNHLVARYSSERPAPGAVLNGAQVALFTGVRGHLGQRQSVPGWVDPEWWITGWMTCAFSTARSACWISTAWRSVRCCSCRWIALASPIARSMARAYPAVQNTPSQDGGSVRGSSLRPGSGSSMGYLKVNGNILLNMQDGAFTFAAWIYPTSWRHRQRLGRHLRL